MESTTISLIQELEGRILDVGGGGEGIIGRLYGKQVTAIDNRREELDEIPDCCHKEVMDAANLTYHDGTFDHVTFFYSLMYMPEDVQMLAIQEAARVCKKGGTIHIWDCSIPSADPDPFFAELKICLPEKTIHTTYGVVKFDTQDFRSIANICGMHGLEIMFSEIKENHFQLICRKM